MAADPIQAAEKRGYARGYAAGRRRLDRDNAAIEREERKEAFRRQAFLAALPAALTVDSWKNGKGEPITTLPARVALAWNAAEEALGRARFYG